MPTTNWQKEGNPTLALACHLDRPGRDLPGAGHQLPELVALSMTC
jgi:hypothetical protein